MEEEFEVPINEYIASEKPFCPRGWQRGRVMTKHAKAVVRVNALRVASTANRFAKLLRPDLRRRVRLRGWREAGWFVFNEIAGFVLQKSLFGSGDKAFDLNLAELVDALCHSRE